MYSVIINSGVLRTKASHVQVAFFSLAPRRLNESNHLTPPYTLNSADGGIFLDGYCIFTDTAPHGCKNTLTVSTNCTSDNNFFNLVSFSFFFIPEYPIVNSEN